MRSRHIVCIILALAVLLATGCSRGGSGDSDDSGYEKDDSGVTDTYQGDGKPVLMLGRSTMWGWFKHWGWDGAPESMPMEREGYALTYQEIACPPDIASDAVDAIEDAPSGSVVFFKFCFDDFPGWEEAAERFEDQQEWAIEVADKARERGLKLIIGNALPKTASATDPTLVAEHREFNAWLEDFAADRDDVWVYDFYSVLTATDGSLRKNYATSSDDSHPNDAAYSGLDPGFFTLLDEVTR